MLVVPNRNRWLRAGGALRGDVLATIGGVLLLLITLLAIFAPLLAPFPADAANATHPQAALLAPSWQHWLGTDQVGRDELSRVLYGARTSLFITVVVLVTAAIVGCLLGVTAGYVGGWLRDVIMRVTDIFLAFPSLLLSMALAFILTPSLRTVILAIAVTWWPWYVRLTAAVAQSAAGRGYVDSARCLGVPAWRIVLRHILPNSLTPVIVQLSLDASGVILTAASLSFLGLGVQEPRCEWGLMIQEGENLYSTNWWVVVAPAVAMVLTAFAFNMLGEGLRAKLDPRRVS
jgi:peptide/nickel transport system permease protein